MAASAKKVQNKVNLVSYCIKTLTLNLHAGLQHVICKSRGLLWSFFKWSTWNIFKLVHFSKNGYPLVLIQKIIFVHLFSFFGNFKTDHFIKLIIFLIQLTKISYVWHSRKRTLTNIGSHFREIKEHSTFLGNLYLKIDIHLENCCLDLLFDSDFKREYLIKCQIKFVRVWFEIIVFWELKSEWCGEASVIGGGVERRQDGATAWRREIS